MFLSSRLLNMTLLSKLNHFLKARYGNPAYRDWFDALEADADSLVKAILPDRLKPASIELAPYLVDSFGNRTRIDYGTGEKKIERFTYE